MKVFHARDRVKGVVTTHHGGVPLSIPGFHERLAYARWLRHLRTGECTTDKEIADATDRSSPWVTKWKVSEEAPADRHAARALSTFFGIEERWLMDGEGEAPEPDLWPRWEAARRSARARKKSDVGLDVKGRPTVRDPRKGQRGAS